MKYSLRSLMIAVTLVGVVVGGRIEYLRRWAVFHERKAEKHTLSLQASLHLSRADAESYLKFRGFWQRYYEEQLGKDYRAAFYHQTLAEEYRTAISRPWKSVDE